jgi:hypothetical protein
MARPPLHLLALACVAALVQSCGGGTGSSADAGSAAPDPAAFGLVDGACQAYEVNGFKDVTLETKQDTTAVQGVTTYQVTIKRAGLEQESLWFEVTADALLLHRRRAVEAGRDTYFIFTPAPIWWQTGLDGSGTVETKASTKASGGRTGTFETLLRVAANDTESVTVGGTSHDAEKFFVTYEYPSAADATVLDSVTQQYAFVTNLGLVKIKLGRDEARLVGPCE